MHRTLQMLSYAVITFPMSLTCQTSADPYCDHCNRHNLCKGAVQKMENAPATAAKAGINHLKYILR